MNSLSSSQADQSEESWWSLVDPSKLDQEIKRRLLERLVKKLGVKGASELLGVDQALIYRMRKGRVAVGDHHVPRILSGLSQEEFEEELTLREKLESLGIISEDKVNYTLLLRSLVLGYVTQHYREELRGCWRQS